MRRVRRVAPPSLRDETQGQAMGDEKMARIEIKVPDWLDRICALPVMLYRRCKYGYTFRRIPLGEGKFTIVEPEDYYRFNNFHWSCKKRGDCFYAFRLLNSPDDKLNFVLLHREIMNAPKGMLVDHRDGKGLDNRRANLRLATRSQNNCNRRKKKTKALSQYVGVTFDKRNKRKKRWFARIYINGKCKHLGCYKSELEAAKAYDEAAKKYFGEFSRLNLAEQI